MAVDELGGVKEWVGGLFNKVGAWINPVTGKVEPTPEPTPEPTKFPWVPVIVGGVSLIALVGVVYLSAKGKKGGR